MRDWVPSLLNGFFELPRDRQAVVAGTLSIAAVAWVLYATRLGRRRLIAWCVALSLAAHLLAWGYLQGTRPVHSPRAASARLERVPIQFAARERTSHPDLDHRPSWERAKAIAAEPVEFPRPQAEPGLARTKEKVEPVRAVPPPERESPAPIPMAAEPHARALEPAPAVEPPASPPTPTLQRRVLPEPGPIAPRRIEAPPVARIPTELSPTRSIPLPRGVQSPVVPERRPSVVAALDPAPPTELPAPAIDPKSLPSPGLEVPLPRRFEGERPVRRLPAAPSAERPPLPTALAPAPTAPSPPRSSTSPAPESARASILSPPESARERAPAVREPIRRVQGAKDGASVPAPVRSLAITRPNPPPAIPAPRSPFVLRTAPDRMDVVRREGGSPRTEKAVADALQWLAAHQSPEGFWDSDEFFARCPEGDACSGPAIETGSDTGLTGLALLAFLAAGHTHRESALYRENVDRGLGWLLRTQRSDGDLREMGRIYCHSMATLALCEAYAMTKDESLRPAAAAAVDYLVRAQHAGSGGWRYGPGEYGDTSVFGWAILALRSAKNAGLVVPDAALARAKRWLPLVEGGVAGGLACYRPGYDPSHAMTAEALFCRVILEEAPDARAIGEASSYLLGRLPDPGDPHIYYWYYATLALHELGGPAWRRWNDRLVATLLSTQETKGHAKGSWAPQKPFGVDGGRVFSTAASALCLEVYYRYLPLYGGTGGTGSD